MIARKLLPVVTSALIATPFLSASEPGAGLLGGFSQFWHNFKNYWTNTIASQNGMVLTTLIAGAIGIFLITRSKAKK